jgi:HAAS
MNLSQVGESRVNGYLFVLERSLKSFLPIDIVRDATREIESHVRERVAAHDGSPNEREALERILAELGPPLRVAQAYSAERIIDEAVTTGRVVPIARAVWHLAITTVRGFFVGLGLLCGYLGGLGFLLVAVIKPLFPQNAGIQMKNGWPVGIGAQFPAPAEPLRGGYWIIPICLVLGFALLVLTHRGARAFLGRSRNTLRNPGDPRDPSVLR